LFLTFKKKISIINNLKASPTEKKKIISKIVIIPDYEKRNFWNREFKFLNDLYKTYSDFNFWKILKFDKKYESMNYFFCDHGKYILQKRFLEYNYIIPQPNQIKLGKKTGKDKVFPLKIKKIKDVFKDE